MNAILLAVGDELTSGQTVDTNSAWLAQRLAERGVETLAHLTVADDRAAIAAALGRATAEADLVIATGGLGPTDDDVTREGLADAMGAPLELDERSAERIAAFFRKRGREMKPSNRRQAMIPVGARALDNDAGTAPGIAATLDGARVFVVPGVPHEMRRLWERAIAPELPESGRAIRFRTLHTFGKGESDTAALIADLTDRDANPTVGTTVAAGMVSIRVTARADSAAEADRLADETVARLRERLGDLALGEGDGATVAGVVGELLRGRGQTVAVAESCTGGLIGKLLTDVPGAGDYFLGGVIAYRNDVKTDALGVPPDMIDARGAVSEPVAEAMAGGCRERFGADWALGITGIAGPTGGTPEKPVGLVHVGVAGPDGVTAHRHVLPGDRPTVRLRSALTALNHLRLALFEAS